MLSWKRYLSKLDFSSLVAFRKSVVYIYLFIYLFGSTARTAQWALKALPLHIWMRGRLSTEDLNWERDMNWPYEKYLFRIVTVRWINNDRRFAVRADEICKRPGRRGLRSTFIPSTTRSRTSKRYRKHKSFLIKRISKGSIWNKHN